MPAAKGILLFEQLMRFRPEGLTANAWAVKAGIGRNFWNDLKRHGNPSRRTLEKLLAVADSSLAEFEALRVDAPFERDSTPPSGLSEKGLSWHSAAISPLPIVASAFAGEWGTPGNGIELTEIRKNERIESMARPASLAADPEAYAVTIVGDSMWPRFRPGRRIAVSPRSPVAVGDDVVVLLGSGLALIKELARRTAAFVELRQFNPDRTFQVNAADVLVIQKVAGELF